MGKQMMKKSRFLEGEENRQRQIAAGCILGVFGLCMCALNFATAHVFLSVITILLSLIGFITAAIIAKKGESVIAAAILYIGLLFICSGYLIGGTFDGISSTWFYILPICAYVLFGWKIGFWANVIAWLVVVVLLWTPFHFMIFEYSSPFLRRFPIIYTAVCMMATVLELMEHRLGLKLQSTKEEIEYYEIVDKVSGAMTYVGFKQHMRKILEDNRHKKYALLVMDIVHFKIINEYHGYQSGNNVLKEIADCLRCFLREGEAVSRVSADHFCILIENSGREELVQRIEQMNRAISMNERHLHLKACFGVRYIENAGEPLEKLYSEALLAKSRVKKKYAVCYEFFDDRMKDELLNEQKMEKEIEAAFKKGEFVAFIQPKYDLHKKQYCGGEALIRWKKEKGTMVSPDKFIPFMEENGLIIEADYEMLRQVCCFQRSELEKGRKPYPISVNISRGHLYNPAFCEELLGIVDSYGIPYYLIEAELTETLSADDDCLLIEAMEKLHRAGIVTCMDDFGTGYSTFKTLIDLPMDVIKLDKSLFDNGLVNEKECRVVQTLIELSHSLNCKVLAEGIETKRISDALEDMGCDIIQGYYYGKPMTMEKYADLYEGGEENPAL